jgi:hypothetical protein
LIKKKPLAFEKRGLVISTHAEESSYREQLADTSQLTDCSVRTEKVGGGGWEEG